MNRESMKKLRLDRRLAGRNNWISPADLEKERNALPDVSDKVAEAKEEAAPPHESETVDDSGLLGS